MAYVDELVREPAAYYRNNVGGTANLLEAMRDCAVAHIVFSSTCATYGIPAAVPITEQSPQAPINPYGATKMICERMLRECAASSRLTFMALRYFNATGADPDGEIGECHVPETHALPRMLDVAAGGAKPSPLTVRITRQRMAPVSATSSMSPTLLTHMSRRSASYSRARTARR